MARIRRIALGLLVLLVAYLLLWFFVPRQEEPSGFDAGPMHPA